MAARVNLQRDKEALVKRLLDAKESTGKTFTVIAEELGLTNAYTAQLFYNQARCCTITPIFLRSTCFQIAGILRGALEFLLKPESSFLFSTSETDFKKGSSCNKVFNCFTSGSAETKNS